MKAEKSKLNYKKAGRLRKNYQFQNVYKKGKSIATANTVLFIKKNSENHVRLGISVSKKVGKSVLRHRLKRLYLEAFRALKKDLRSEGYDLVIIVRKGAAKLKFKEVLHDLARVMIKGNLFKC